MWHVDVSFAVDLNMRNHTGGGLTMGRGSPIAALWRLNWNIKSSMESEWVGADEPSLQGVPRDYSDAHFEVCGKEFVNNRVSTILWTCNFLLEQGYGVQEEFLWITIVQFWWSKMVRLQAVKSQAMSTSNAPP